ncbi:hypothetical protein SFR_5697 [Streptomyces sp. FR-008]|nr:hypothetical protein SFR_5697 [Streptomyces sp. FR-008]
MNQSPARTGPRHRRGRRASGPAALSRTPAPQEPSATHYQTHPATRPPTPP